MEHAAPFFVVQAQPANPKAEAFADPSDAQAVQAHKRTSTNIPPDNMAANLADRASTVSAATSKYMPMPKLHYD